MIGFLRLSHWSNITGHFSVCLQRGKSAETAQHHLVSKLEMHLGAKGYTKGALLDIEGAFFTTCNVAIKPAKIRYEVCEGLVEWVGTQLPIMGMQSQKANQTEAVQREGFCLRFCFAL